MEFVICIYTTFDAMHLHYVPIKPTLSFGTCSILRLTKAAGIRVSFALNKYKHTQINNKTYSSSKYTQY